MPRKIVYVDTMVFLHWPSFKDLDWLGIVEADEVEVVIPAVVFYEIDAHKDKNASNTIKKRARKVLLEIESLVGNLERAPLKDGVTLHLDLTSHDDFAAHELSKDAPDDHLILEALHRVSSESDEVVILSGDSTMRVKARRKGLGVYWPPEESRLEDPQDEYQRRMAEMAGIITELKGKGPILALKHQSGDPCFEFRPATIQADREEYIKERLAEFNKQLPVVSRSRYPSGFSLMDEDIGRFEDERATYFQDLRESIGTGFDRMLMRRKAIFPDLVIENSGSGPATSVHVRLIAPDGVRLYDARNIPQVPKLPNPPKPPKNPLDFRIDALSILGPTTLPKATARPKPDWSVQDRRVAEIKVERVVQHAPFDLPELAIVLDDTSKDRGFHLDLRLVCAEFPEPQDSLIHFRFLAPDQTNVDADEKDEFLSDVKRFHLTYDEEEEDFKARVREGKKRG